MAGGPKWFDSTAFSENTCFPATSYLCTTCMTQPSLTKAFLISRRFESLQHAQSVVQLLAISHVEHGLHLIFFTTLLTYEYPMSSFPQNKCFILLNKDQANLQVVWYQFHQNSIHVQSYPSINQYLLIERRSSLLGTCV